MEKTYRIRGGVGHSHILTILIWKKPSLRADKEHYNGIVKKLRSYILIVTYFCQCVRIVYSDEKMRNRRKKKIVEVSRKI